jgi:hypothetical protein
MRGVSMDSMEARAPALGRTVGACFGIATGLGIALGLASASLGLGVGLGVGLFVFMSLAVCRALRG